MPLAPLTRPLVIFDLETTGLLVDIDRIIEIALIKIFPDGRRDNFQQRFDPGIKIPIESVAIHGITNAALAGQPPFREWASRIHAMFEGADLGGFALRRLDIPILTREFGRVGLPFPMEGRRVVDASVIFREKERRNLGSAYRFYCGKELVDAHSALADVQATWDVLLAQMEHYADLPRDMDGLHAFCHAPDPSHVDPDGRLTWRDGEAWFNFGKHRYHSLEQVAQEDPDYLHWIVDKADFSPEVKDICRKARRGFFPRKDTSP